MRTLGCVELHDADGKQVLQVLRQPKRLALLTYLALSRPYGFQRRDRILLLFWPDSDEGRARAALRKSTYVLRQALGSDVIQSRGDDDLAVDPKLLWCDVREFDAALAGSGQRTLWACTTETYSTVSISTEPPPSLNAGWKTREPD